jgi:uncharacterized membrane protein YgcG
MVQPKYSPEEALERVKLMMKYDTSKTLNENKETIKEQYEAPTVAAGVTGAGVGAGLAAKTALLGSAAAAAVPATATSAAVAAVPASGAVGALTGALGVTAPVAGAIVGGAAALAVLPLVYWLVTKDTGANKVKKMFEMCSTESAKIAKLQRKMQDTELRSITDDIEDAIINDSFGFQGGTDEEKLFGAFKKLEAGTASDFCALVAYYNRNSDSGDLFDDLDSDIDAESEWKQIYRPIRNCVEDSLLGLQDEAPTTDGGNTGGGGGGGSTGGGGYKDCAGSYTKGCKAEAIKKVQGCLGLVADGKFGPKTEAALKAKGFSSFTDAEVDKICNKPTTPTVDSDMEDVDGVDPNDN